MEIVPKADVIIIEDVEDEPFDYKDEYYDLLKEMSSLKIKCNNLEDKIYNYESFLKSQHLMNTCNEWLEEEKRQRKMREQTRKEKEHEYAARGLLDDNDPYFQKTTNQMDAIRAKMEARRREAREKRLLNIK